KLTAAGGKLLDGSRASIKFGPRGGEVSASGLTLPTLANLPPALPLPNDVRKLLTGLKPVGRVDRFDASWKGDWREPTQYAGHVAFAGLGLSAPAPWPTLGPLDGDITVSDHDGKLNVAAHHFRFAAKDIYDDLALDDLSARADWTRNGDDLTIRLTDFAAHNVDIEAGGKAIWHRKGQGVGELQLDAIVARLAANKVGAYLPQGIGPDTRKWLAASLLQGEARNAHFKLSGPLDKFPFPQGQGGTWNMTTQVHGATLAYAPNWPKLEGIDGEVRIDGDRLDIDAAGRILGTHVDRAHGVIEHLSTSPGIQIDGSISGPTSEYLRFIASSPLDKTLNGLGTLAHAEGEGTLNLKLDIPFENADNTHVEGHYHIARNRLQIGSVMPEVRELTGEVVFDEHGVTAKGLAGTSLGGPMRADISTERDGAVLVAATGRADSRQVFNRYGIPAAESVAGVSDYRVQVNLPKTGMQIAVTSTMTDVRVDLPAPLGKPAGEARALKLGIESQDSGERWRVSWGDVVNADVYRVPDRLNWRVDAGDIVIGAGNIDLSRKGLWLDTRLATLDLDPWLTWLKRSTTVSAAVGGSVPVAGVTLHDGVLQGLGNRLDDVALEARPQVDGSWAMTVASRQLAGTANWSSRANGKLVARLDKLMLPLPDVAKPAGPKSQNSAQHLPALDVVANNFSYSTHDLGRVEIKARPDHDNWIIDALNVENPDGKLALQGVWRNGSEGESTAVKLDLDSANIGKLLDRFGYEGVMQRGRGSISGDATWHGGLTTVDYPSLGGNLKIKVESGQFAKVNPGVGRLLGVLSLQSLPRRLTLDFHDVFSQGFAFDKIDGDSKLTRGVLATDNLTIVGPAAQVYFKGEANLADETQKLRVRIIPTIGDSVAVGAGLALANPVVGVGALLLQRALKDPLGHLVSYEYDISGRWDDPQVVKVLSNPVIRHMQTQSQ
ncbi:MAG: TIGR02099 family protein, partial [Burkholderiales bacterium]|nr:TIGR02099 family protein [Burkholderiales bacterium]